MTLSFLKTTALALSAFLVCSCGGNTSSENRTVTPTETTTSVASNSVPVVEGSAGEIANTWCELMRKEFRAKNGGNKEEMARTAADVTAYQKNIEEKYGNDQAVMGAILTAMGDCDAAKVGKE